MLPLLQSSIFPSAGWIAVSALAILALFYQLRANSPDSVTDWLEKNLPTPFPSPQQGWKRIILLVTLLGGVFFFILWPQSLRAGLFTALGEFFQSAEWRRSAAVVDEALLGLALLATLAGFPLVNRLFGRLETSFKRWRHTRFRVIRFQSLELLTPDQLSNLLTLIARYLRWAALACLGALGLTLMFSLYPETRGYAQTFLELLLRFGRGLWEDLLGFLPKAATLGGIAVAARLALKALHFFHDGLQKGKIRTGALHAELIEPTYQLARFFLVALALVAAFPYIPGSSSPVFRGISIFVGFLLSLGSTSLVSNVVAGIALTYTRGLKIGDRVQVANATGDVIDRSLLALRIRTIKNEIITVPNNLVLQNQIVNYSTEATDSGLILHTSVTIGYDVPWRTVNALLLAAARRTPAILQDPQPFVLKTSLDDYYIQYEINAYTAEPEQMAKTYSQLHENILDAFNQAGVEILSPAYMAIRDGAGITIPQSDLS